MSRGVSAVCADGSGCSGAVLSRAAGSGELRPLPLHGGSGRSVGVALVLLPALLLALTGNAPAQQRDWKRLRELMVQRYLVAEGITNERVLESMRNTPRHLFVPPDVRHLAYLDMALPIGGKQTISPPYVVAYMTQMLDPRPEDRVLEIGTGSGYQAAVLSPLVKEVYTIEIVPELARRAESTLRRLGYLNVFVRQGDGFKGWPEKAPFDKIIVTCSPQKVPRPLVEQLKPGGLMIIPLGERYQQRLYLLRKEGGRLVTKSLEPTWFVPMTGRAEALRRGQDPQRPRLLNGGFEHYDAETGRLEVWYYQRQCTVAVGTEDDPAPQGKHYAVFRNTRRGRMSQALQACAVNGKLVRRVQISGRVRLFQVSPRPQDKERAVVLVLFFDEDRRQVGQEFLGMWRGTSPWKRFRFTIRVPSQARHMVVGIGLFGAVGRVDFDDLQVQAR